jgi:hypothetical protein
VEYASANGIVTLLPPGDPILMPSNTARITFVPAGSFRLIRGDEIAAASSLPRLSQEATAARHEMVQAMKKHAWRFGSPLRKIGSFFDAVGLAKQRHKPKQNRGRQ